MRHAGLDRKRLRASESSASRRATILRLARLAPLGPWRQLDGISKFS